MFLIEKVIHRLGTLICIYLTGDFARGKDSPVIDLILVGENIARRRAEVPRVQSIISDELARLRKSGKPWSLFQDLL